MNIATALLLVVVLSLLVGSGVWWLFRHPMFAIHSVSVQGEVTRNNALTLQAHVMPQLQGNFFTIDLNQTRDIFQTVPWVRVAVVHRDFPNRLRAVLQEHQALALWGEEGASTLLNEQGQIFEANTDDLDVDKLPRMKGPADQSLTVARMFKVLSPLFAAVNMDIDQLELTPRGGWRVLTEHGAVLELGRGTDAELVARLNLFFKTLTQVTTRYGRTATALAGADLRHKDGYALRLRGVSTLDTDNKKKP
ncbi:MAG: cell division protein FtsQ [Comamonadaceae bacterium PBBC1]|nr:MAG: cell division protein FtsQ [Comamonadaceae bacterium PBBC1]